MVTTKNWYKSYNLYPETNNSGTNNSELSSFWELRIRRVIEIHDYTVRKILDRKK